MTSTTAKRAEIRERENPPTSTYEDNGMRYRRLQVRVRRDDPAALSGARATLCEWLRGWALDSVRDTAALLASELITNTLQHSGGSAVLAALPLVDVVRLEVYDSSTRTPRKREADEEATSGRGLMLIEALAESWGVDPSSDGKCVWCEIPIEPR
ncbi:ATP-binding protein [Streptomyces sp. RB6PN25]|uniref:ATP-binding protein n=1 Tax=Streptomyces humicola TaxID=2953240 RepID=A0ABT1PT54_9ACTN|nr:ATP-binding protein [Streptomyces humicola]MCQ4080852.1 ATP-binding protein [Streptomyces humicola]